MRIARRQEHLAAGASNQRGHAVDTQDLPVHLRGDRGIEPALNHDEQPGEAESCHPSRGDPDNLADHEQVQEWSCSAFVESGLVAIRPAFRTEPD